MLAAAWNPAGFHLADFVLKGVRFCFAYLLSHSKDPLFAPLQSS
jgi:hypothetical protein